MNSKKYSAVRRPAARPKRMTALSVIVLLMIGAGGGWVVWQRAWLATKITTFLAEHRSHTSKKVATLKNKPVTVNKHRKKVEPEPIHFEFYTALPKMQVERPTPSDTTTHQSEA